MKELETLPPSFYRNSPELQKLYSSYEEYAAQVERHNQAVRTLDELSQLGKITREVKKKDE